MFNRDSEIKITTTRVSIQVSPETAAMFQITQILRADRIRKMQAAYMRLHHKP